MAPSGISTETTDTVACRALVSGLVQGVGYRYSLTERARDLNIRGWCRNLPDGRVEAWLQGSPDNMERILAWIHQGPPGARVDHVEIENQAVLEPMLGEAVSLFEIRK